MKHIRIRQAETYRAARRNAARASHDLRYWRLTQRLRVLGWAPLSWRAPGRVARELWSRFGPRSAFA